MPEIGEIRSSKSLGLTGNHRRHWIVCPDCKDGRWVPTNTLHRKGFTGRCHQCNALTRGGKKMHTGGRWVGSQGYVYILVQPEDFFYPMARDGYVLEHRLVMAKAIGRNLHDWEIVHHKNHNRSDNRLENLQLVTDDRHKQLTILENRIAHLEKRITLLEAENVMLRKELAATTH